MYCFNSDNLLLLILFDDIDRLTTKEKVTKATNLMAIKLKWSKAQKHLFNGTLTPKSLCAEYKD